MEKRKTGRFYNYETIDNVDDDDVEEEEKEEEGGGGEKKVVDYIKEISDSGSSDDNVLHEFST